MVGSAGGCQRRLVLAAFSLTLLVAQSGAFNPSLPFRTRRLSLKSSLKCISKPPASPADEERNKSVDILSGGSRSGGERDGLPISRRVGIKAIASAVLLASGGHEAGAICGGKPAAWEFWVPWEEGAELYKPKAVEGSIGERGVYYRVVGNSKKESVKVNGKTFKRKPLLLVADKFKAHDYLTTFEAVVTSDRRVVEYDGMGSGLSQELPKEIKLMLEQDGGGGRDKAVAFAVEELGLITSNLAKTLKVEGFHLFGHGFGAEVVQEFAKTAPSGIVASMIFAAPPKSLPKPEGGTKVMYLADPANLCAADASNADRETFVQSVIEFLDDVDGTPTSSSQFPV